MTPAFQLYQGKIYQPLTSCWKNQCVDILIVSAAYGLVIPDESLREYELQMGDILHNGCPIYRFWQTAGLPGLLKDYARHRSISHVWSLLPDSNTRQSKTPYHRLFRDYWDKSSRSEQKCFWVKVDNSHGKSVGTGSGTKRGEWLAAILRTRPEILTEGVP